MPISEELTVWEAENQTAMTHDKEHTRFVYKMNCKPREGKSRFA